MHYQPEKSVASSIAFTAYMMPAFSGIGLIAEALPFWRMALNGTGLPGDATVDRCQICRSSLHSHIIIDVGVALEGRGGHEAENQYKASSIVVISSPPKRPRHTGISEERRVVLPYRADLTNVIHDGQGKVFIEDLEMLQLQHSNLDPYPDRNLLKLNIDAGGVRARMIIDRAIGVEVGISALT